MVDTEHPRTDTLYAKSDPLILFDPHSQAVADATVAALDSPAAARATHPARIPLDRLRTLAALAGLLHDTGKLHPDWQAGCRQAIATGESGRLPFHSSRSALIAFHLTRSSVGIPGLDAPLSSVERMAIILSILHHHTQISERNQRPDAGLIAPTDIDDLLDPLGRTETFDEWTLPRDTAGSIQQFRQAIERVRELSKASERFRRIASLTTVLRSALIQADHHASSKPDDGPDAPLPTSLTEDTLTFYDEFRPFQQAVADRLTASAPCSRLCGLADCGAGKTQTALQWGDAQRQAGAADRLVIAMPTRTTSNNLFHAITSDHTDPSDVALHHSTSDRIYSEAFGDERDLATVNAYPRRCKWFQKPITICTVDHLLATLVNNDKHSDIARGNLRRAAVVFDEIHAYDQQLLRKITGAISHFDAHEIPWYVMTATCPPELEDALDASKTVRDPRRDHAPYRIEHHDQELSAAVVADSFAASDARAAMVVKNTVRDAQQLALRLDERTASDVEITYYSSEFPSYDREAKEREVREQFAPGNTPTDERRILVCTQVCELSLDISVDTLYTDLAPVDAVIQRAGRLHRRGDRPNSQRCECVDCTHREGAHPYVCHTYFDTDESTWYPYATERDTPEWELLVATRDVLDSATTYSFENARQWMSDAYSGYDLRLLETAFHGRITTDSIFGPPRWDGNRIVFRTQNYRRLPVVASQYDLHDTEGTPVSFRELWERLDNHECHGDQCLGSDRYTPCHEALYDAIEDYSIEIPAYWLFDDEIQCNSQDPFPETSRVSLQEVTLSYSYQWGIENPQRRHS
jgi:CRISPR-associated helicase Cas3/CRISPR-associated endonuclease Cas3-HD